MVRSELKVSMRTANSFSAEITLKVKKKVMSY